ncbi:MAG: tyrosine-type recombinase/integrase [Hyphomicrobium sp.]
MRSPPPLKRQGPLNRLSALEVRRLAKPGWHADGGGLYLEVDGSGAKRWALRLTVNGRRRDFGLGPLWKVPLQAAREQAAEYRVLAYRGVDPIAGKRAARKEARVPSFEAAAREVHEKRCANWSNGKHVDQWINSLKDHAFPVIGSVPVNRVGTPEVLQVLTPIWLAKPETARRIRQRLRTVLDWARAAGHRSGDNPVDLIGEALPKQGRKNEHHEALPYQDVGHFIRTLHGSQCEDATKLAFEFLILTATRTSEVRFATWGEIDFANKLWSIPAGRMKARRGHVVPLTDRAIAILKEAEAHTPKHYAAALIFRDGRSGEELSENRFLNARDRIGYTEKCTPHGFRSSFRDWAAEETTFPAEVVEMALAHTIKNKVEAAYRRGDLLKKRRDVMEAWEKYVFASR